MNDSSTDNSGHLMALSNENRNVKVCVMTVKGTANTDGKCTEHSHCTPDGLFNFNNLYLLSILSHESS